MKNTIFFLIAAFLVTASVNAQSTVDSIHAKYQLQPMPDSLTIEKTFPVLGSYQMTTADGAIQDVNITLDSASKGIIWISGLPEGIMKAFLRKSPATYRIIAQKSESGTQVPEGTLYLDTASKTLNVALGKPYDDADPVAIFNLNTTDGTAMVDNGTEVKTKVKTPAGKSKTKSKLVFYTATKTEANMSSTSTNAAKQ